jgi:disulfide bond formation protein DsbB
MTRKHFYWLLIIIITLLLGTAYYLEYAQHVMPCSLCIMQRVAYFFILGFAIAGLCKARYKIVFMGILLFSLLGIFVAARQMYLQYFAGITIGACGPNLQFMLSNDYPLSSIIKALFYGSGDCAIITIRYFGLSLADYSLVFFSLCFIGNFFAKKS